MNSEQGLTWRRWTVLGALGLCGACADFSRGEPSGSGASSAGLPDATASSAGGSSATSSATYAADIHPVLLDGCASCHSSTGTGSDTELVLTDSASDDYPSTLSLVDLGSPDASRLVVKMEGRGHGGGAIYTRASPRYALVL